ncbi:pyridoxal-phosphate dependent enzyme [Paraburkholderia sediminicola]|uniref:pyridoxal-phosphate dependent enzyme n=1 Tax=Paraburkholderia sediminicola TaxID=458836 RepID=UPI0038BC1CB0
MASRRSALQIFDRRHRSPATRIVAVSAAGASAMVESWRAGRAIEHENVETIADGIATKSPIPEALQDMHGLVDDALLVSDAAMIRGMKMLHVHAGVVAEPSAAAGVAAILENREAFAGLSAGLVVCGGNLTEAQMRTWL